MNRSRPHALVRRRRAARRLLAAALTLIGPAGLCSAQGWSRTYHDAAGLRSMSTAAVVVEDDGHVLSLSRHGGSAILLRTDAAGNLEYCLEFGVHAGGDLAFTAMTLGPSGDVFLCGQERDSDQPVIARFVPQLGGFLWIRTLPLQPASLNGIAAGTDGSLLAVGRAPRGADQDVLAIRFQEDGIIHWQTRLGDLVGDESGVAVTAAPDGGYTVVASSDEFGDGRYSTWIFELDVEGFPRWQRALGNGDFVLPTAIDRGDHGDFFVSGYRSDGGVYQPWMARIAPGGALVWDRVADRDGALPLAIQAAPDGGVVCCAIGPSLDRYRSWLFGLGADGETMWQVEHEPDETGNDAIGTALVRHPDGGWVVGGRAAKEGASGPWTLRLGEEGRIGPCCPREGVVSHPFVDGVTNSYALLSARTDILLLWTDLSLVSDPLELIEDVSCSTCFGQWTDLGNGLAGSLGVPCYAGVGSLQSDSFVTSLLTRARPFANATLVLGFSRLDGGIFGGNLVPFPDFLFHGLNTGIRGELHLPSTWPAGLPAGIEMYLQYLVFDPAAPRGVAMSNAVRAITP